MTFDEASLQTKTNVLCVGQSKRTTGQISKGHSTAVDTSGLPNAAALLWFMRYLLRLLATRA
eukprot:COSAG02_NODE_7245_length_3094_cov_7.411137_2_plen_62_part_00